MKYPAKHQRVLIIGSSGAGKSTLSRTLSELWELPLVHLDAIYWKTGWQKSNKEDFIERLHLELKKPAWIIDGNFDSTLEMRAKYADLIIFLDFSNKLCTYRVLKRTMQYRGRTRPDMGEGCPEKVDAEFLRWIWRFPVDARPGVMNTMIQTNVNSIIFSSPSQLKKWLRNCKIGQSSLK
ncbi:adenylate kinase [Viridibacillus arvi]|uniref:adenylate kinase n=1 Tax=Viridibacillus arvi TaxID=263475 RepID=UPI00187B680C|nr:adenylate kinase [Viridibacillus sp. JNUCC-6]QOV09577.1 adenylate kinase [Viridibacillus sp. JNUCC-6]